MTESQKIELRRSEGPGAPGRDSEALAGDAYTAEIKTEERSGLQDEYTAQLRSSAPHGHSSPTTSALEDAKGEAGEADAEQRERVELRSKARLGTASS